MHIIGEFGGRGGGGEEDNGNDDHDDDNNDHNDIQFKLRHQPDNKQTHHNN